MKRLEAYLEKGTAALILTEVNRRYLTNFASSLGFLFVTSDTATLIVDGRYLLAAKSKVKTAEVILMERVSEQLGELVSRHGIKNVLTETSITVAELDRVKAMLEGTEVSADGALTDFLSELRSVKTEREVESIVSAQRIAEKAFSAVLNIIKPGVSERDIAAELEYKMKLYGSEGEAFDTIAVSGYKSAMPHGVPDDKPIENGDFVTFDFGATVNGYRSDMTRTVAIGFATDKMRLVYDTVLQAQLAAEKAVRAGVSGFEADKAARDVITSAGFGEYFTHSTGHSLGLEIHESPNLSQHSNAPLKAYNVVTDEPGIYIPNEFGVRLEDMLLVTDTGCENLTTFEKTLIIIG